MALNQGGRFVVYVARTMERAMDTASHRISNAALPGITLDLGFDNTNPRDPGAIQVEEDGTFVVRHFVEENCPKGYSFHFHVAVNNDGDKPETVPFRILWGEPDFDDDPFRQRSITDIQAAEEEFFDKLWYYRSKRYEDHEHRVNLTPPTPEALKAAADHCKELEKLYPAEELPPWSVYQYGEVCGKLSALRWVLGYEWDMLDT